MPKTAPVPMVCIYRVKPGKRAAFRRLLERHWPALRALGLASRRRARVLEGEAKRGEGPVFIELFEWAEPGAADRAHGSPEVLAIWGPMEGLLESMELVRLRPGQAWPPTR